MAKQLLNIPLDKGIDQSKDTAGGDAPDGLRVCTNLWHRKRGVLSTRPGTLRAGGALTATAGESFAGIGTVEGMGVVLSANSIDGQTRPRDTDDAQIWFDLGGYAAPVPVARRDIGEPATATTLTKHVAIWRHLMLIADTSGTTGFIQAYDRTTGALLARTTLTDPASSGMKGGWACHGDAFAPTLLRWDNSTGLLKHQISDTASGAYNGTGVAVTGATVTGPVVVCGLDDGSYYAGETTSAGRIFYISSYNANSLLINTGLGVACVTCASYGGRAYYAGVGGGNVTVAVLDGPGQISTDSEACTNTQICIATLPYGSSAAVVFSNSATDVSYQFVSNTGVVSAQGAFLSNALVMGGAMNDGIRARVWFIVNSAADPLYAKLALLDVLSGTDIASKPVLYADFISDSPASCFPQATHDGFGYYSAIFQEFLDLPNSAAQNVALDYKSGATRPVIGFGGRPMIPGGVLFDISGDSTPALPITGPHFTAAQGTTGALQQLGAYRFVAIYQYRDSAGAIRQSTPSEVVDVTLTGSNNSVTLTIAADGTLPDGWEVVVFRTLAAGRIYYRDSAELANIQPGDTFSSVQSDTAIRERQIFYQNGGALANDAAPSHSFAAVAKQRLWVGGLWRPFRLQFSKETIRGEAVAFPDDPSHWLDLEKDVTGIAGLDDAVLAFHRDGITLIAGDGPDARGVGSFVVRPIAIGIGANDWRSVLSTPIGVFFAGNRSIWLMGRGFSAPENIGASVRDVLADYPDVISSALVDYGHQQCVQFLCRSADGANVTRLVFSLRSLSWYRWTAQAGTTLLGETFVRDERRLAMLPSVTPATGTQLLVESDALTSDAPAATTVPVAVAIQTHDLHSWGIAGDARAYHFYTRHLTAEASTWTGTAISDGGRLAQAMPQHVSVVKPGYQVFDFHIKEQAVNSIGLALECGPVTLAGILLEYEGEGVPKLNASQRKG